MNQPKVSKSSIFAILAGLTPAEWDYKTVGTNWVKTK